MTSPASANAGLQRGDIVIIADRHGELTGKPRPAIVLQSSLFPTSTVTVCPITTITVDASLLRIALEAGVDTGLEAPSWAAIDQVTTIRRRRANQRIGRIDLATMTSITRALVVFLGIEEQQSNSNRS
jgi:mRNA interferase MazF